MLNGEIAGVAEPQLLGDFEMGPFVGVPAGGGGEIGKSQIGGKGQNGEQQEPIDMVVANIFHEGSVV